MSQQTPAEKQAVNAVAAKFKTAPAPAPGSRMRFRGAACARAAMRGTARAGGLTDKELLELVKAGPPGAGTAIGTGGVWGSSGAGISGYGTVQSCTLKRAALKEEYDNDDGETVAYLYYNFRSEGRATLLVPASFTELDPGDTITVNSLTLYVDEAELQWEHKGWQKYAVAFSAHDTLAVT